MLRFLYKVRSSPTVDCTISFSFWIFIKNIYDTHTLRFLWAVRASPTVSSTSQYSQCANNTRDRIKSTHLCGIRELATAVQWPRAYARLRGGGGRTGSRLPSTHAPLRRTWSTAKFQRIRKETDFERVQELLRELGHCHNNVIDVTDRLVQVCGGC